MKSSIFYMCWIVLGLTHVQADDNLAALGYEAEAFMLAQEYNAASSLFEQLDKESLPGWQQAIINYNLGTIKLAQNKLDEAKVYYQRVSFKEASTPQVIRSLFLNQAVSSLKRAQNITPLPFSFELMEKMDLYRTSIRQLTKVYEFDCQIKQLEGEDLAAPCKTLPDLNRLFLDAQLGLEQAKNHYGMELFKSRPFWAIALIIQGLQNLDKELQIFNSWTIPQEQQQEYSSYLLQHAESLQSLWEAGLNLSFNREQKTAVNQAAESFKKVLAVIQEGKFEESLNITQHVIHELEKVLRSFENYPLERLLFHYQLTLLKKNWTSQDIVKLKKLQGNLKEKNPDAVALAHALLEESLMAFEKGEMAESEFYLRAAFQVAVRSAPRVVEKPMEILIDILNQAWQVKIMMQLTAEPKSDSKELQIIRECQRYVIALAKRFLPIVLAAQSKAYNSKNPQVGRCQKQPWDQVIPLFDQGYQSALIVLDTASSAGQMLENQINAITQWQKALQILFQYKSETQKPNEEEHINAVFRLIQEMQSQDQIQKPMPDQKLHTW